MRGIHCRAEFRVDKGLEGIKSESVTTRFDRSYNICTTRSGLMTYLELSVLLAGPGEALQICRRDPFCGLFLLPTGAKYPPVQAEPPKRFVTPQQVVYFLNGGVQLSCEAREEIRISHNARGLWDNLQGRR